MSNNTASIAGGFSIGQLLPRPEEKQLTSILEQGINTIPQLMQTKGFSFLDRVKNVIEFVEEDKSLIEIAIIEVQKHMASKEAGKAFLEHLKEFKEGGRTMAQLKEQWKKAFE